jgi:ribosomal protein S18 acetylase RimI-like enzyme
VYEIIPAITPAHIAEVRHLFGEYAEWLQVNLCFQGFQQELAELPGKYAPPKGAILLAVDGERVVGCVALRPLEENICEMKRLYVRPVAQGQHVGERLVNAIISEGRRLGYDKMRLDTLPEKMGKAIGIYRRAGFLEIAPYYENPYPVLFLELDLRMVDPR